MTTRSIAALVATFCAILCLTTQPAAAQSTSPRAPQSDALRMLVSNGMKGSMEALQQQGEKAVGRPLAIEFGSTASLKKRIETGEAFDVTIITTEAIDDLIKQGTLTAASRMDVGRSELGIGIRAGAPRADIRTPEALKKALLEATSITYPQDGASRGAIEKMFEQMGIAAEVKPRIILAPGSGPATESVAAGKAAMVLTLFSEILPTPGVEILGPLPGPYQLDIRFGAATSAKSKNAEAVRALIAFLSGPTAAPVLKAKGIERLAQTPAPAAASIANKLDTPQARVYVATLLPRTPSRSPNGHATNRLLVYLDDGVMTRQEGTDKQTIPFHRGDVRWRPASGAYVAENTSDHPIRILEVDLKGRPAGPAPVTPLDPALVDARHYKVELENDQVRVLRVHYDAHDQGARHEHILNRVVVYLNDQPGAKADDVRMSGAGTHTEQNASDQPADRIAIEIK